MNSRMKSAAMGIGLVALGFVLFACDEVYADPVTAPFSSSFPGVDAGLTSTRTPPVPCSRSPQENGPCSQAGSVCEYGTNADQRCNTLFVCASDTRYGLYWTEQTPGNCTAECPDPAAIVEGAPCDVGGDGGTADEAELHCTKASATCICTTGRDGAHAHTRRWVCKQLDDGCPANRPLLGQPCFGERSCDYGSCESKRGSRMLCEDDVWQTEVAPCN